MYNIYLKNTLMNSIPNNQKPTRDTDQQKLVKKIKNYIYDPSDLIGSGFSSTVYKGVNELNNETIAIKVLELSKIENQVQKYLLNNEINALRALNHKNILRTIQILMTKNNVYIMTEYCQNGDLQQYIKKKVKLIQWEALHIIRDVAEGYQSIQQKKIVHRDIKSANIFLTLTGARIADFGFCQFLGETKKPQISYNVGSPAYMSPESYKQTIYSAKSDIWSIGIILYEMLIGETPDKNLTYTQMANNLMSGKINCGASEEIKKILLRCFKKELKERITTAQLIEAINTEINRTDPSKNVRPQVQIGLQPQTNYAHGSGIFKYYAKSINPPSFHPLSPSEAQVRARFPQNRHMLFSMLPEDNKNNQSPFKGNTISLKEDSLKIYEPSPRKTDQRLSGKQIQTTKLLFHQPIQIQIQSNRFKSYIQMLLFLYRLLNYLSQSSLEKAQYLKIILFRQRSFLQNQIQRIIQTEKIDKSMSQPYKQFQFLKSRFDESYLLKQVTMKNLNSSSNYIMKHLNDYSNSPFLDQKALTSYCLIILEAMAECDHFIKGNFPDQNDNNKVAVLLDYIMIELEILDLYSQDISNQIITQQIIHLEQIMKQQPKKLQASHFQLLGIKCKALQQLFSQISNNLNTNVVPSIIIDPHELRKMQQPWMTELQDRRMMISSPYV